MQICHIIIIQCYRWSPVSNNNMYVSYKHSENYTLAVIIFKIPKLLYLHYESMISEISRWNQIPFEMMDARRITSLIYFIKIIDGESSTKGFHICA